MFRAKHKRRFRQLFRSNRREGMGVEEAADAAGAQLVAEVGDNDFKFDSDRFWEFVERLIEFITRLIAIFGGDPQQAPTVLALLDGHDESDKATAA